MSRRMRAVDTYTNIVRRGYNNADSWAALGMSRWRIGEHFGGPGRNPHRRAAGSTERTSSVARLYQHRGERHEHRATRVPQREAMVICPKGAALGCGRHAGSGQGLPTTEGSQAASCVTCRSRSTLDKPLPLARQARPSAFKNTRIA
jgi:hypothetical protein